jgi:hypothetical protein
MFPAAWVVILVIAVLFATAKIMAPVTNAQIMLNILLISFQKATMIYKILVTWFSQNTYCSSNRFCKCFIQIPVMYRPFNTMESLLGGLVGWYKVPTS